ncbi:hypothetical protein FXF61_02095 [Pseudomonas sp. C27(2019)]|uniref:hypothetical protein n=1 Tax=Pseudomonas sp. C27(2019) TaxID=2604941 RepID=UPI00124421E1|nr:hypothetical protein [Pseudomonas sp. C27(2019)]QEY58045.1 hypothetical protein FXF61_02095 [Pseudomonas sp. C27(2019)]
MLFHYVKTRKRQAIHLAINILILPLLLYMFHYTLKDEPNFEQIYVIVEKVTIVIVILLVGLLIWFLKSKEQFEIYVTDNKLYSYHPVFKEWCFSVNPKDIVEIEHQLSMGAGSMTNINVHLNNGQKHQVCQNYSFSREELYSALQRANPKIKLPDDANLFKHKLSRAEDEYISTRFPVATKIIKSVFKIRPNKTNRSDDNNQHD